VLGLTLAAVTGAGYNNGSRYILFAHGAIADLIETSVALIKAKSKMICKR